MIKKILIALCAFTCLIGCAFALTACESEDGATDSTDTTQSDGKHKHKYSMHVVEPSCTDFGYTMYTCDCGDSYTENLQSPLGHSYLNGTCLNCGARQEGYDGGDSGNIGDNGGGNEDDNNGGGGDNVCKHHALNLAEIVNSTCIAQGYSLYRCDECGKEEKRDYTPLGNHDYQIESEVDPTCTADGYYNLKCSVCHDETTESLHNRLEHEYEFKSTVDPTCAKKGYDLYECSYGCGATEKRNETDTLPHAYVGHDYKQVTCTEDGWDAYRTCENCDYTEFTLKPALGHDWKEYAYEENTCTYEGHTAGHKCKRCDLDTREVIPADHKWTGAEYCERCYDKIETPNLIYNPINGGKEYEVSFNGSGISLSSTDVLYIPAYHDNKPVTKIADSSFTSLGRIARVVIPYTVEEIGAGAFNGSPVQSVDIKYSGGTGASKREYSRLKKIGGTAFANCANLYIISILEGKVEEIGDGAFSECSYLHEVDVGGKLKTIATNAFYNCQALESVRLNDGITSIGNQAFAHCRSLKWTDKYTGGTRTFFLPSALQTLGEDAFINCSSISGEVTVPQAITAINAFDGCTSLTGVILPRNLITLGGFKNTGITALSIPSNVTEILEEAFLNCASLEGSVTIPAGVTVISSYSFEGCTKLAEIILHGGITEIGYQAFKNCTALHIQVENDTALSLSGINKEVFSGCVSNGYIVVSSSVTYIGEGAFAGCGYNFRIFYHGTKAQWEQINIHSSALSGLTAGNVYFYSETRPTDTDNTYWHYGESNGSVMAFQWV